MADKLEPCPFCGGEADIAVQTATAYGRCMQADCLATGPSAVRSLGDNEAARLWNTRTPKAADEITRLNAENAEWKAVAETSLEHEAMANEKAAEFLARAEKAEALVDEMREGLTEANGAIGVCIDGFEKSNPTLGGLAAIHMLKEARTRYAALITKAQPPVSHD